VTAPFREPIDLDTATALDGADGSFAATLVDNWQLWGPSGGYTSAIALRAAGEISELARPTSYFCHFVRPLAFGEVEVVAKFIQQGRRAESIAVEISQNGKIALTALVRTAGETSGYTHQFAESPATRGPEGVEEFRWDGPRSDVYTYWNNFERRPLVGSFTREARDPVSLEWVRSIPTARFENPFLDAARPLLHLDTFGYPATTNQYPFEDFIAPNLDTSAWFHNIPAQSDWLLIDHGSPVAQDGVIAVDGRVWSEDGTLVATGVAHLLQLERPAGI
jgi:acyl-CoA thioesterase